MSWFGHTGGAPSSGPDGPDGSGAANQVAYWSDDDSLTGSSGLTYDGTDLSIDGGSITTTLDDVGETTSDAEIALHLINTTAGAASPGLHQFSPMFVMEGQAYDLGNAASQEWQVSLQATVIDNTENTLPQLSIATNYNDGGWTERFVFAEPLGAVLAAFSPASDYGGQLGETGSIAGNRRWGSVKTGIVDIDAESDSGSVSPILDVSNSSWSSVVNSSTGESILLRTGSIQYDGNGAISSFTAVRFLQQTVSSEAATGTVANAATVYIANAPAAGANTTLTASWSLWVDAGQSKFDGNIVLGQLIRLVLDDDEDTYITSTSDDVIRFFASGVQAATLNQGFGVNTNGTVDAAAFRFDNDPDLGIRRIGTNTASLCAGGDDSVQWDNDGTAGNTRLLVYDVDNAQIERVTVGVADSGGAGFKVLRIPN